MKQYEIFNRLNNINSICIIGHLDPDADALSSMVVFKNFLNSINFNNIDLYADCNTVSKNCKHIISGVAFNINNTNAKYDLAIALDCTNLDRLGKYAEIFTSARNTIEIDHHATNTQYANICIVEDISSTCELVYKILKEHHYNFTEKDYEYLYSGIITDTNNFTTSSTNNQTHIIAGEICEHININKVYNRFFSNFSMKNMDLFASAIKNIVNINNNEIIISYIDQDYLTKTNSTTNDLTGIINRLTQIENNKLACFIQPKSNNLNYISLRSKKGYNVGQLAEKYGGGGHDCAAGFNSELSQDALIKLLSDELIKLL